jgi:hypothetical protein
MDCESDTSRILTDTHSFAPFVSFEVAYTDFQFQLPDFSIWNPEKCQEFSWFKLRTTDLDAKENGGPFGKVEDGAVFT